MTTNEVRELVGKTEGGNEQKPGEVRQIVEKVNRASDSLESALKNLDNVSGRLDRGEGTLGRLTKDEKLINEVEGVAESVGDFVGGVSRLQTIVVLRTDYQFLAAGVKSYVELRAAAERGQVLPDRGRQRSARSHDLRAGRHDHR